VPSSSREAKQALHDALQEFGAGHPELEGAVLVRTVIVSEWVMPESGNALYRLTTGPDGAELRTWEVSGLLASTLAQVLAQERNEL
jgi:hypothetical protein